MGPRQSQPDNENKGEGATKIQENYLNLGLVNFQQETFIFKRVHRIELGVIFIIIFINIFLIVIWRRRCKKRKQKRETNLHKQGQNKIAPQIMIVHCPDKASRVGNLLLRGIKKK